MGRAEPLPGLDLDALTRWLDSEHPGLRHQTLVASRLTGGLSNLTYALSDGTSRWALRRPPLGHALPTAHDMAREHRILTALAGTGVPVAAPVLLCEDAEVIGAPFYVMQYVDGIVLDRADVITTLTHEQAERSCTLLVDTLLALHAIDPDAVGLGGLGRPTGYCDRQLRRWMRQWEASETTPRPEVNRLAAALQTSMPPDAVPGIVHGDYRLSNVIYSPAVDRIAAVVDWEMATLGDPLADVGLLVVYHQLSHRGGFVLPRLAPEAGFLSAGAMVERYAARAARDLSGLDWYVAFGWFKLAVIAEGIHRRYVEGATVGSGFDRIGESVPMLLASGLDSLTSAQAR